MTLACAAAGLVRQAPSPDRVNHDRLMAAVAATANNPAPEVSGLGVTCAFRVEGHSLVPVGEVRLGRIGLDERLRRSPTGTELTIPFRK